MKSSIKNIFNNLKLLLLLVVLISLGSALLVFEHDLSFKKVDNLTEQKRIVRNLTKLDKSDIDLALIQFNGQSTKLHQEIDKLKKMYEYNIVDNYILGNKDDYFQDIATLSKLVDIFNTDAQHYYNDILKEKKVKNPKIVEKAYEKLQTSLVNVITHIDTMLLKNIKYDEQKFYLLKNMVIAVAAVIILLAFWYRRRLTQIYKDIEYLFQLDKDKKGYEIFSIEAGAIALRMNRKAPTVENPDMLDKVTGINNYKGMLNSYAHKKGLRDSNFTSVTVFEVDNFSKTNRPYPQDVTQAILKKVANTMSLHEQPVDVIARTDYNQFTIILSRPTKEQCFKEADLIRESISELKFNVPNVGPVKITLTGGHIVKPSNTKLEEAIKQAKEILAYAKSTGTNKIFQTRDMAQRELK